MFDFFKNIFGKKSCSQKYQKTITYKFNDLRKDFYNRHSNIKENYLFPTSNKIYYNSYFFQKLYACYKKYKEIIPTDDENCEQLCNKFENEILEVLDDIYESSTKDYKEIRKNVYQKIKQEKKEKYKEKKRQEKILNENKVLDKNTELINTWGIDLAKYKYPDKFDIYKKMTKDQIKNDIGKRYERYIGYLYETDGYRVDFTGITKGLADGGVDLICKKRKEVLIIQCKRYRKDSLVRVNTIQQLKGVLDTQKRKNSNKNVKAILYTANDNLDIEAQEELTYSDIQHIVLEHPLNEDYPLIKCNINEDSKEKIYHLPNRGMYDRIKIELKKGECYVETIEEAKKLGFRESYS